MTIGERIKQARKLKGLTQKQLGELSETSEITVRQYELGKRQPRLEQLQRISTALGVEITELVPETTVAKVIKESGLSLKDKDGNIIHQGDGKPFVKVFPSLTAKERIDAALDKLNAEGQQKAVERVEELTDIPKYQRQSPQDTHTTPLEGTDTAPPESPSEGTGEGTENK